MSETTTRNVVVEVNENRFGEWFGFVRYLPTKSVLNYSDAFDTAEEALAWARESRAAYLREFPEAELGTDTDDGQAFARRVSNGVGVPV